MKGVLKYIALAFIGFLAFSVLSSAQDVKVLMETITQKSSEGRVVVEYGFSAQIGDDRIEDKGVAEAQGDIWCLKGMSIEIYTDGKATWLLYPEVKEAVVEPAWSLDDLKSFYESAQSTGNVMDIKILSVTDAEIKPVTSFTPSLDDDWVVTDLR